MTMTRWLLLAAPLILAGCVKDPPARTRWADGSRPLIETVTPVLSISSLAASKPATKFRDLPERAAAQYVDALAAKISEPDKFRAALAGGLAPKRVGDADQTELARTLSVGIGKDGHRSGQRFLSAKIVIVPVGFVFADLTQVASQYTDIDLENVSIQSTTTAKLSISPELGNVIEVGEASIGREDKRGTSYGVKGRNEALTPDVQPGRIILYQQSQPNEDLTGSLLASLSVAPVQLGEEEQAAALDARRLPHFDRLKFEGDPTTSETVVSDYKIADDTGKALAADKASLVTVVNRVWLPRPLFVCAGMTYITREPSAATAQYYDEGRQVITESRGVVPGRLYLLVPEADVGPSLWVIADEYGPLMVDTATGPQSFSFTDPLEASRFAFWLNSGRATSVGIRKLWTVDPGSGRPRQLDFSKGVKLQIMPLDLSKQPKEGSDPALRTNPLGESCWLPELYPAGAIGDEAAQTGGADR